MQEKLTAALRAKVSRVAEPCMMEMDALSNPTIPAPAIWLTELTAASKLYFKKPGGGGDRPGTGALACFSQRGRVDKKPPSSDSFKLLGKCFSVKFDHFWLPKTPENAAG
ncbi:hypothetical protein OIU84_021753 [Salix udensis]|uniref:Uncharacterized protein n=1 Tax=Salix udensis TaxID=889485 RepID=A0AAD6KVC9_9ROSI|nr:hypothetical protein OIU84_021753 [Salix udensis]